MLSVLLHNAYGLGSSCRERNPNTVYGHCACTEMRIRLKTAPFVTVVEEAITTQEPG
jgi:hypothetical protein